MTGREDPVRSQFRWVSAQIPFLICARSTGQFREKNALVCLFSSVLDGAVCPLQVPMSRLTLTPTCGLGLVTDVIVKCSSKTPPLDPSSKRRMSVVILLPPLPCKIASPRGLSDTPWGFTTHTYKPLSLAMLSTFTPNSNSNQPCFYLSDLSSPIFEFSLFLFLDP